MSAESMDAARLQAAAVIAAAQIRWLQEHPDPHKVAHEVLQLERELRYARKCRPPDGSYRAADLTCSYGWEREAQ